MKNRRLIEWFRNWWNHNSIRDQIFFSMILVTMFITFVLGNFAYNVSRSTIEKNYKKSHIYNVKNASTIIDLHLDTIIEVSRSLLNEKGLQSVLENSNTYDGQQFTEKDQKILKDVVHNLTNQEGMINSIAIMDLHGHYYLLNNINLGTYDFYEHYKVEDFLKEDWSKETREALGREVFFGSGVLGGESRDVICFTKYLINPSTREPMGYMVVNISKRILEKSFIAYDEGYETNHFMVVDDKRNNMLVYFSGEEEVKPDIMEAYPEGNDQDTFLFSSTSNNTTGWSLINVIEKNELSRESKMIRTIMFVGEFGIIILCFGLARAISGKITSPLNLLEQTIQMVGEGKRHITEEFDDSEVGVIGRKFKEMVNNNLELSDRLLSSQLNEREAELLLLQSQINPHFLYNTLDSLYCMAMIHEDDQIAEMVLALSNTFKLSLNNGEKFITVEDSVQRIKEYMKIQNMRFLNRFELKLDISEEIWHEKIINFILQPFIENAMYHGLEPKVGKGSIQMSGWKEENKIIFTIEDDGVGISDLTVLEKGYGIQNVKERIHLIYGDTYGVSVESHVGIGTKITIIIPSEQRGEMDVSISSY